MWIEGFPENPMNGDLFLLKFADGDILFMKYDSELEGGSYWEMLGFSSYWTREVSDAIAHIQVPKE